jgi:chemotaxis protein methyltransferase CheR
VIRRDAEGLVPMSQEEFRLVRDLIRSSFGICFGDDMRYLIQRRLSPRLQELGYGDFTEYYHHLVYHPNRQLEFEEIVERITTNETYFFREAYQLRAFAEEILPELARQRTPGKRLTIWSAGCSTGEEVYTVAILVLESATEERFQKRYFRPVAQDDPRFQIDEDVRSLVSFGQINLVDDDHLALVAEVDIIFCRNVLIYFDAPERKRVLKLVPGGYLLLGHSESLINLSTAFELVHLKNDMVYRRPVSRFGLGRWGGGG